MHLSFLFPKILNDNHHDVHVHAHAHATESIAKTRYYINMRLKCHVCITNMRQMCVCLTAVHVKTCQAKCGKFAKLCSDISSTPTKFWCMYPCLSSRVGSSLDV